MVHGLIYTPTAEEIEARQSSRNRVLGLSRDGQWGGVTLSIGIVATDVWAAQESPMAFVAGLADADAEWHATERAACQAEIGKRPPRAEWEWVRA
jgi:hypothetical protein